MSQSYKKAIKIDDPPLKNGYHRHAETPLLKENKPVSNVKNDSHLSGICLKTLILVNACKQANDMISNQQKSRISKTKMRDSMPLRGHAY